MDETEEAILHLTIWRRALRIRQYMYNEEVVNTEQESPELFNDVLATKREYAPNEGIFPAKLQITTDSDNRVVNSVEGEISDEATIYYILRMQQNTWEQWGDWDKWKDWTNTIKTLIKRR